MKNVIAIFFRNATVYVVMMMMLSLPCILHAQEKKVEKASQNKAVYGERDAESYIKHWHLLGPIPVTTDTATIVDMATQQKFFDEDPYTLGKIATNIEKPVSIGGKDLRWKLYLSKYNILNLDSIFQKDYAIVYAQAEIVADSAHQVFFAVGSDDGVKVWHNENLIHKNWIGRGVVLDQDILVIPLIKGRNHILIAVQDMSMGWGLSARVLNKAALSERLTNESGKGNLDEVNMLLKAGAETSKRNALGLTALNNARLNGREDIVKILLDHGAREEPMPATEKLIDNLYKDFQTKVLPGVAVLVSKDGKILYKKAFGYADVEKKEKLTADTKFRIGSITKQFTAAAILKLQEENKLTVTDKLSKYFPDFPRGDEVTLHHLLTHTSGIHSYTGKSEFLQKVTSPVTNEALLDFFKNDPYDFNPGEQFQYNNSGYFLLGYIIEKVSGKKYSDYLNDVFFKPLAMNNTGVHASTLKLKNEATGHMKPGAVYERAPNWDMSWAGGAGAMYSTLEDLHLWNEALYSGKVVNDKSFKAAMTAVKLNNGKTPDNGSYGYGFFIGKYRETSVVEHGGGLYGFVSQLARYPEEKMTVTILTNISPSEANMNSNLVAQYYLWEKMGKQMSYATQSSTQDLKQYEGRYDFKNGMVMTVTSEADVLFAQLSGQSKFQIYPSAPDEFLWKVVEAKIKFQRSDQGLVTGGHFTQGGNEIDAPKLADEKIINIDPSIYKNYTGKYDYGNNFHIVITTENDKIFAQGTNQPRLEIYPISEKEFVVQNLNAKIRFVAGADGKVDKLNLDMGGQKKDALKIE